MTIKKIISELGKIHKTLYGEKPFNDRELLAIRKAIRILETI